MLFGDHASDVAGRDLLRQSLLRRIEWRGFRPLVEPDADCVRVCADGEIAHQSLASRRKARHLGNQARASTLSSPLTSRPGSAARMTPPMTAMPIDAGRQHLGRARGVEPADRDASGRAPRGDLGRGPAADLRPIAGLARGRVGRAGDRVVDHRRIDRLRPRSTVWIDMPMSLSGPRSCARRGRIAAGRQMHAVDAGRLRQRGIAMQRQARAVARAQAAAARCASATCSSSGRSFSRRLAQRQPAANAAASTSSAARAPAGGR